MTFRFCFLILIYGLIAVSGMACAGSRAGIPHETPSTGLVATSVPPTRELVQTPTSPRAFVPTLPPTVTNNCLSSREAIHHLGESVCVRGNVARTYATPRAFFIEFDTPGKGFFGTSLTTRWEIPQGACVQVNGTLLDWQGRAYVVLDADAVKFCDGDVLPYRVGLADAAATQVAPTARPIQMAPTQAPVPSNAQTVEAQVVHVVDGDTIDVNLGGQIFRVRYIGVDTPETVHPSRSVECMGREASAFNTQLVQGQTVRLEKDVSETDRYGRLLRYVYVGNVFVVFDN